MALALTWHHTARGAPFYPTFLVTTDHTLLQSQLSRTQVNGTLLNAAALSQVANPATFGSA